LYQQGLDENIYEDEFADRNR